MFEKILRFFINNTRLNYFLFVLIVVAGVVSYIKTPKEIFPTFDLDMVGIFGHYSGASIDTLDNMAVKEIENEIKNIDDISKISTIISSGSFQIIIELTKGTDRYNAANRIKDAISLATQNIPSDMDDPVVKILQIKRSLISVALSSNIVNNSILIQEANKLKDKILSIKNIAEVKIYGDSDQYYDISLQEDKIEALGLDTNSIVQIISSLSYTFPVGKVEDPIAGHYYLSTYNGAKTAQELLNSKILVGKKAIKLTDIAIVKKRYKKSATKFSINTQNAVNLDIRQSRNGNAIEIVKKIEKILQLEKAKQRKIKYTIHNDQSEVIKDRLNIIISNILLGLILIGLLVILLINKRMTFVIMLGIPTSFLMGAVYFYFADYTINMISLIGVLIALGIIVDDAIVVSENIQQYIEKGLEPKEAAMQGAKEMFKPVTIASATTLFAFLPALMMSGTMGEVIKLIPIAVSILIVASLIESFIFLPIHAAHILKKSQKTTSWTKVNRIYGKIIHLLMGYRKSFLLIFIILVPLLTILGIKQSKFQLFSSFDATKIDITLKSAPGKSLEETYKQLKMIERDLYEKAEEFSIKTIGFVAGWRRGSAGDNEEYPYVGMITIELHKQKPQSFIDKYITPNLSFYYDSDSRTRDDMSTVISEKLRDFIRVKDYKNKLDLLELSVVDQKVGPVKSDIKIGLAGENRNAILDSIKEIENELKKTKGIVSTSSSLAYGIDEIKLKVNDYGESLGITEKSIGAFLSSLYLEKKVGSAFDKNGIIDIKVKSMQKDSMDSLRSLRIKLTDGRSVSLQDIAEFKTIKSLEKVIKDNAETNFYVYANIDKKLITASETLKKLTPLMKQIEKKGIKISLKGEAEKNQDLKRDMITASILALLLIMLSLLYLFNSFRDTFMMMSVIPFSFLGVLIGHFILNINLSMPSIVGVLGLSGVVVNDGIIMIMNLKKARNIEEIYRYASSRFRPIILTTITTIVGLSSLVFFPTGQAVIFQPMAAALAFGLAWGTVLNLLYLPVLYVMINQRKLQ